VIKLCKDCEHDSKSFLYIGKGICKRPIKHKTRSLVDGRGYYTNPCNRKCSNERVWWGFLFGRCGSGGQFWKDKDFSDVDRNRIIEAAEKVFKSCIAIESFMDPSFISEPYTLKDLQFDHEIKKIISDPEDSESEVTNGN